MVTTSVARASCHVPLAVARTSCHYLLLCRLLLRGSGYRHLGRNVPYVTYRQILGELGIARLFIGWLPLFFIRVIHFSVAHLPMQSFNMTWARNDMHVVAAPSIPTEKQATSKVECLAAHLIKGLAAAR